MSKRKQLESSDVEMEDEEEEQEDEGEEFEIDVIDAVRVVVKPDKPAETDWEYHVKWVGYSSSEDTWEPHSQIGDSVPDLLGRLWKELDPKNKNPDYAIGQELEPSKEWIAKERRATKKRIAEQKREEEERKKEKARRKEKAREKEKKGRRKSSTLDDIAFEVRAEEGLNKDTERLRSGKKNSRKAYDDTKRVAEEGNDGANSASEVEPASDGASDTPLAKQVPKAKGPTYVKPKENPYTLDPKANGKSASAPAKKRKLPPGGKTAAESSDEEDTRARQARKRRSLDPSLVKALKETGPAAPANVLPKKGHGKAPARASVDSSSRQPSVSSRQGSLTARNDVPPVPPPAPPPASRSPSVASDQEDGSLFGSSPSKAPPKPAAPQASASAPPAKNDKNQRRSVVLLENNFTGGSLIQSKSKFTGKAPAKDLSIKTNGAVSKPAPSPVIPQGSGSRSAVASPVVQQGPRSATTTPAIPQKAPTSWIARQGHESPALHQSPANMSPPPAPWNDETPTFDEPMAVDTDPAAQAAAFLSEMEPVIKQAQPAPAPAARTALGRIPKKWKWEGELHVCADAGTSARLARVSIVDPTEPDQHRMRLNILLQPPLERLTFARLVGRAQFAALFADAAFPPSHFARMAPADGEADGRALSVLAQHMAAHDLGTCAYIDDSDGMPSALLVVFPSARLAAWCKAPVSEAVKKGPLVVAVYQWRVAGEKIAAYGVRRTDAELTRMLQLRAHIAPPEPAAEAAGAQLRAHAGRELARRVLGVPAHLLAMLSDAQNVRKYAIWHDPSDRLAGVGRETGALRALLRAAHAGVPGEHEVPPEAAAVRVLFVHVGSVRSAAGLARIHRGVQRRRDQVVQFHTYGTHHTVPPACWGVREVFTTLNAVTFGPGLVQEAFGPVRRIVEMAEEHEFWMAFVTPSVLAFAAIEAYGEDPLKAFDEKRFVHGKLLKLITDGKLALLYRPPTSSATSADHEIYDKWVEWHRDIAYHDERGVLEQCLRWFHARYEHLITQAGDKEPITDRLRQYVLEELKTTVDALMVQPAMVDSVRRFVVVLGKNDRPVQAEKCAFEWEPLAQFDFGDNFWQQEDMDEMRRTAW